jgi:hypothetical protein
MPLGLAVPGVERARVGDAGGEPDLDHARVACAAQAGLEVRGDA